MNACVSVMYTTRTESIFVQPVSPDSQGSEVVIRAEKLIGEEEGRSKAASPRGTNAF